MATLINTVPIIPFAPVLATKTPDISAVDKSDKPDITINVGSKEDLAALLGGGTQAAAAPQQLGLLGLGGAQALAAAPQQQGSLLGLAAAPVQASPFAPQTAALAQQPTLATALPQAAANPMASLFAAPTLGMPQSFGQMAGAPFAGAGMGMNQFGAMNPAMMGGMGTGMRQPIGGMQSQQQAAPQQDLLTQLLPLLASQKQEEDSTGIEDALQLIVSMISGEGDAASVDGTEVEDSSADVADDQGVEE